MGDYQLQQIVLPESARQKTLELSQATPFAGQLGINKTKKNILKTILLLTGYLSCYVSEIF